MTYETNEEYKNLVRQWRRYKEMETDANDMRIAAEKSILRMVGKDLNEKGVNHLPENLDVTTGMTETWDMADISRQSAKFEDGLLDIPYFPFDRIWKANNKKLALIKESAPNNFEEIFSEALTIKPKKPSFKIKEKKA